MKNSFPGQFSNKPDKIKALWENGLIALDANVLLDLYRYSDSTRAALINVLELLKERIWISNQVAKEYFSNRLKVIGDQAKLYDSAISELGKLKAGFENQKQHPFIGVEALDGFVASFDKVVDELKINKEIHDGRIYEDDIKNKLGDIFDGRVGAGYEVGKLEEIVVEGAVRFQNKVPPGFKDAAKGGDGVSLSDRCAPYGDYIGWLQLMEKSKESGLGVIYVTGDNKEDWWLKQSGKTIGPLPELVEEFVGVTDNLFYMYQPDRFLEYANGFLQQEASPDAVEEIRDTRVEEVIYFPKKHLGTGHGTKQDGIRGVDVMFPVDSLPHYTFDSLFDSGLGVEGCKAYISNLNFRMDIVKSGLDRRFRELDMIKMGVDIGRETTDIEIYKEMMDLEKAVGKFKSMIVVANHYLATLGSDGE
ncbi:PIN-like domain-containing protein [Pseudomonas sp.]|uniref:PIN-like domain-containing protein n=1 Tax=Pseudomonas sp. TaxID=306 RepID=UPI003A983B4C